MKRVKVKTIKHIIWLALVLAVPTWSYRRGPAENQLTKWNKAHDQVPAIGINYQPVPSLTATVGLGVNGPLLEQDTNYQAYLANVVNEDIPERIVHAKGVGAKGYFIVTNSMAEYTKAAVFSKVGLKTPVVVRLSTVVGNSGSADTVLDMRGFAIKFKTTEGIYDLTMSNVPAFPIRDVIKFPELARSRVRNPNTHVPDINMFFDFASLRPESTFNIMLMHSNLTFFKNYRHMEGFTINSFMWTGGTLKTNEQYFVRYHIRPDRKSVTNSWKTYMRRAGNDPDYMTRDLYNAIASKKYPRYILFVQLFTSEDARTSKFNMFDATKILFESDYPLIPIGKLVLNENPTDFFNEVNQAAYSPGNLVPGIEMSQDRLLQGRPFGYIHAQIHRIGPNFFQLPINRPIGKVNGQTYFRNGPMNIDGNGNGGPTYYPNSFNGSYVDPKVKLKTFKADGGKVTEYDIQDRDNYFQADRYWREMFSPKQRRDTIETIATRLAKTTKKIQKRSLKVNWDPINDEVKTMMRVALRKAKAKLHGKGRRNKKVLR